MQSGLHKDLALLPAWPHRPARMGARGECTCLSFKGDTAADLCHQVGLTVAGAARVQLLPVQPTLAAQSGATSQLLSVGRLCGC